MRVHQQSLLLNNHGVKMYLCQRYDDAERAFKMSLRALGSAAKAARRTPRSSGISRPPAFRLVWSEDPQDKTNSTDTEQQQDRDRARPVLTFQQEQQQTSNLFFFGRAVLIYANDEYLWQNERLLLAGERATICSSIIYNMGLCHQMKDIQSPKALECYKMSLKISRRGCSRTQQQSHCYCCGLVTIATLNNAGLIQNERMKYTQAIKCFRQVSKYLLIMRSQISCFTNDEQAGLLSNILIAGPPMLSAAA